MWAIDPSTTLEEFVRVGNEMKQLGFTVGYIFAREFTEREQIIELVAAAVPQLA